MIGATDVEGVANESRGRNDEALGLELPLELRELRDGGFIVDARASNVPAERRRILR